MWNFKGVLWNLTENFEPTHPKICISRGTKRLTNSDISVRRAPSMDVIFVWSHDDVLGQWKETKAYVTSPLTGSNHSHATCVKLTPLFTFLSNILNIFFGYFVSIAMLNFNKMLFCSKGVNKRTITKTIYKPRICYYYLISSHAYICM